MHIVKDHFRAKFSPLEAIFFHYIIDQNLFPTIYFQKIYSLLIFVLVLSEGNFKTIQGVLTLRMVLYIKKHISICENHAKLFANINKCTINFTVQYRPAIATIFLVDWLWPNRRPTVFPLCSTAKRDVQHPFQSKSNKSFRFYLHIFLVFRWALYLEMFMCKK
jgi:hypothetical protein